MLVLTTETIPGKGIKEVKGLVKGSTVRCKNIGKDIASSFKNLVGGEMNSYTEMLTEARQIALFYGSIILGSIILIIWTIRSRIKEKKREKIDHEKYKKY